MREFITSSHFSLCLSALLLLSALDSIVHSFFLCSPWTLQCPLLTTRGEKRATLSAVEASLFVLQLQLVISLSECRNVSFFVHWEGKQKKWRGKYEYDIFVDIFMTWFCIKVVSLGHFLTSVRLCRRCFLLELTHTHLCFSASFVSLVSRIDSSASELIYADLQARKKEKRACEKWQQPAQCHLVG